MENNPEWFKVLCQDFARARSLTTWLLYINGEWDQLASLRCDPSDYCTYSFNQLSALRSRFGSFDSPQTVDDFKHDYQITELWRKCSDLPTSFDRTAVAKQKFYEAEDRCALVNHKLRNVQLAMSDTVYFGKRPPAIVVNLIRTWRRLMKALLGPIPDTLVPKFSSGSTFADRSFILPQDKMSSRPTITEHASQVVIPLWEKTLWCKSLCEERPRRSNPRIINGNRFTTVPKDCTTDRGICIEPSLNVTYQLSVGRVIRKRLRDIGIDLLYGQAVHKRIVESASLTCEIGSIDLSSASDTIAYELVKLIVPPSWFEILDSLRSPSTKIDGRWLKNEKFSSMGNGYTFELETALFYTLGAAVCELKNHNPKVLSVYGDDILLDTAVCPEMLVALSYFGFIPNKRKTFTSGIPFRESCGSDFYMGFPVRGHYVKEEPTEPVDYVKLANGIRRLDSYNLSAFGDLYRTKRSWLRVLGLLPKNVRCLRGPETLGDSVIHDHETNWRSCASTKNGIRTIKCLIPTFDDEAYTSYDRRFWTRGSILAAVTLGALTGQGDTQVFDEATKEWRFIAGYQKKARYEPTGYRIGQVVL